MNAVLVQVPLLGLQKYSKFIALDKAIRLDKRFLNLVSTCGILRDGLIASLLTFEIQGGPLEVEITYAGHTYMNPSKSDSHTEDDCRAERKRI